MHRNYNTMIILETLSSICSQTILSSTYAMTSFVIVNRLILLTVGPLHMILGLIGAMMQVFILTSVPYYRNTPCTFYFIIASIHECGEFITSSGPLVVAAFLNVDVMRISNTWCKLRLFFATSCASVPLTCACLSTIDQYLKTSGNNRLYGLSNMNNAYRAAFFITIIWWLHGTLYIFFQEMSPITGICIYRSYSFFLYAIVFLCIILCGMHILILTVFGSLAYRNMKNVTIVSHLRADRQLAILVFIQIFLTLIGLTPYGIYSAYKIATINDVKTYDQQVKEALAGNITYLMGSLTYGVSVFYSAYHDLFLCRLF